MRETALSHTVPRQLAHVGRAEFEDLGRDAVLLHEGFLRVVELEGVVSREGHVEPSAEVLGEGVLLVVEEEAVVAERGDCDADLSEVEQVLQYWYFPQQQAVGDALGEEIPGDEVMGSSGLTAMRSEDQLRESAITKYRVY